MKVPDTITVIVSVSAAEYHHEIMQPLIIMFYQGLWWRKCRSVRVSESRVDRETARSW